MEALLNIKRGTYPKISILVPVRNEERFIGFCVSQILAQTYPLENIELLIIDGLSSDKTRDIVKDIINNRQLNIKLIDNPLGQRTIALNIGIREATGDIILRVDARTIIPADYVEKCVKTLIETGADNVGGMQKPISVRASGFEVRGSKLNDQHRTSNIEHRTLTQESIRIALSHPFGVGNAQFRIGNKSGFVDTVYLGCFRKEIFDKVGLFDEESAVISEDADMNYRIRQAGGKVYLNKDIVAYYYPRDNFIDLWRLYFRYGGAKAGNVIKRGRLTAWRQFVPPTFLLSLILLPILEIVNKSFLYLWFLISGSYIIADFAVSLYLSLLNRKSLIVSSEMRDIQHDTICDSRFTIHNSQFTKKSLFWRLLLVFPTIHFSWAIGFWRRLLQRPKPGEYWGY